MNRHTDKPKNFIFLLINNGNYLYTFKKYSYLRMQRLVTTKNSKHYSEKAISYK